MKTNRRAMKISLEILSIISRGRGNG
jgi:hypothetical protein